MCHTACKTAGTLRGLLASAGQEHLALHANLPAARSVNAAPVCSMSTSLTAVGEGVQAAHSELHVAGGAHSKGH